MNIPELPTDNLYKFLAISGLVIAIVSAGGMMYVSFAIYLDDKYQGSLEDQARVDVERNILQETREIVHSKMLRYELQCNCRVDSSNLGYSIINDSLLDQNGVNKPEIELARLNQQLGRILEMDNDLRRREAVITFHKDEYILKFNLIEYMETLFLIFIGLGIFIAVRGFRMWYQRSQKYQDFILKINAGVEMDIEEELKNLRKRNVLQKFMGINDDDVD